MGFAVDCEAVTFVVVIFRVCRTVPLNLSNDKLRPNSQKRVRYPNFLSTVVQGSYFMSSHRAKMLFI